MAGFLRLGGEGRYEMQKVFNSIPGKHSIPGGKKVLWRSHVSRVIGDCLWNKG